MINKTEKFIEFIKLQNKYSLTVTSETEIALFEKSNSVFIPNDLREYFTILNGTNNEYDERFFNFYSFSNFKSIAIDLKEWKGIPDYSNIVNTLDDFETYYVFADYSFCMFCYAIKLYPNSTLGNEIIVICGDEYKVIAHSFSSFLELYLDDSIELQLNVED